MSALDQTVRDTLTPDFWAITLPNELATSASKSPALLAYIAALNILDADVLLSKSKVRSRLDPAVTLKRGIERHHLFPKGFLRSTGITDTKRTNQIANFALVEWSDNVAISDVAPSSYWPAQLQAKGLAGQDLRNAMYWHALPDGWHDMPYDDFLAERRRLMSAVVRDAVGRLADSTYEVRSSAPTPTGSDDSHEQDTTLRRLVEADVVPPGTDLIAGEGANTRVAHVLPDGRLYADGDIHDTLIELSEASGLAGNPWSAWVADLPGGKVALAVLRESYESGDALIV